MPEYRPQDFVGRGPYLQQLRSTFSGEPMVFLLHGEPGTGKSTLALQFAWDAQKDFDAVVFQTCGQRQSLLVLDDVWTDGDGKIEVTQLEPGPACSVLYTSRLKSLPGLTPKKQTSEVEKFTASEAEELFHTYLDPVFTREQVDQHR